MLGHKRYSHEKKRSKKVLIWFFAAAVILSGFSSTVKGRKAETPTRIDVKAKSAIIVDAENGKVLFEKDADTRLQPASTVKVMTSILAAEHLLMDEEVVATNSILHVEPTYVGLKPGVKYKAKDLISAILIKSGNDAAVAIADAVAGDEKKFVELMNEKALQLGMDNTNFMTSSGLPSNPRESQYSTARDLAKMMRYALKNQTLHEAMGKKKGVISGSDGRKLYLKAHNKSLRSETGKAWGKTGYTKKARRTFVGTDPSKEPKIIIALLRSNDLWKDIATLKSEGLKLHEKSRRKLFTKLADWIKSVGSGS